MVVNGEDIDIIVIYKEAIDLIIVLFFSIFE